MFVVDTIILTFSVYMCILFVFEEDVLSKRKDCAQDNLNAKSCVHVWTHHEEVLRSKNESRGHLKSNNTLLPYISKEMHWEQQNCSSMEMQSQQSNTSHFHKI